MTVDDHDWLAERFEAHRTHLLSDADDAVQETWLRLRGSSLPSSND